MLNTVNAPILEIFSVLKKSPAGKYLLTAPRYGPFRHPSENLIHWRKVLGPSAIIYFHLKQMTKVADWFLQTEIKYKKHKFTNAEQYLLLLAAACHDFGEVILDGSGVGDILSYLKNQNHERIERQIFKKVLHSLNLNKSLKKEIEKAYETVIVDKDNPLFHFFRSIEITEYLMTGLTIFKNYQKKLEIKNGRNLIGNILALHIATLVVKQKFILQSGIFCLKKESRSQRHLPIRQNTGKASSLTSKQKTQTSIYLSKSGINLSRLTSKIQPPELEIAS